MLVSFNQLTLLHCVISASSSDNLLFNFFCASLTDDWSLTELGIYNNFEASLFSSTLAISAFLPTLLTALKFLLQFEEGIATHNLEFLALLGQWSDELWIFAAKSQILKRFPLDSALSLWLQLEMCNITK